LIQSCSANCESKHKIKIACSSQHLNLWRLRTRT
jgi:hypothetical protein